MKIRAVLPLLLVLAAPGHTRADAAAEPNWPQFRGPNGQGLAPTSRIPVRFGPETNMLWRTSVPAGHSSPVAWGPHLFLTGLETSNATELVTMAVHRDQGGILWRQVVQTDPRSGFHELNNPASSTPAADANHVYAYFGTYGLVCYDHAGNRIWERKLETPRSKYGMGTSPILYQDTVILVQDGDGGSSRLVAFRQDTGDTVWEQPRPLFKAGWSTPMIFRHDGVEELVVLGSKRLTAYDPSTGEERWWAGGFPDETVGVPVAGDGLLFACAAALGGRGDDRLDAAETWRMTVEEFDQNHDQQIQRDEMTKGFGFIQRPELAKDNPGYAMPVRDMGALLRMFDHDKNGAISEGEWKQTMSGFAAHSQPYLLALRPGARQDARAAHVAWESRRGIPETPSLLFSQGRLYLMRDGGLLTCLKAATGTEIFRERIGAPGQYVASPVAAGDKLVVASVPGIVTVIQVGDALQVLARNDFKEAIYASPAVVGDRIYLRTEHQLYALGEPPQPIARPGPSGVQAYRSDSNIVYRTGGDLTEPMRERCRLDVYHPVGTNGFATVVWFHGGGLTGGARSVPEGLRGKGIAIVAAGYRLSPQAKAPAYLEDAAAAVAWTFRNIARYGGSTNRIFVSGHSAGGYLTSMLGLDKRWMAVHGIDANAIAGLIPYSGQCITHFTVRAERGIPDKQPVIDDLAPLYHVRPDAPPLLLITGDRDRELLGRYEENAYLWRMMKVVGHTNTELQELPGFDHGQMAEPAHPLLLRFLGKVPWGRI